MLKKNYAVLWVVGLLFFLQGCAGIQKTVDFRKLDTPVKRFHFAQLTFEDTQKDYIAMFPIQQAETQDYLRENVTPKLNLTKKALDAWGEVINEGAVNMGQESKFTKLFDELTLLLKPFFVKED